MVRPPSRPDAGGATSILNICDAPLQWSVDSLPRGPAGGTTGNVQNIGRKRRFALGVSTAALLTLVSGAVGHADTEDTERSQTTATPIKHVIVISGENRTFDNIYGTYVPKHDQSVDYLLSRGIVRADGSPGPHADDAKQFKIGTINPVAYFTDTNELINPKTASSPTVSATAIRRAPSSTS
jgi:hypothetical protein